MLWPIDGFGKVLLPTTCLPEREKPYNLNVEIARAKLMQIVNKREDWSFFNDVHWLAELSEDAQNLFIRAIKNISDPSNWQTNRSIKPSLLLKTWQSNRQNRCFRPEARATVLGGAVSVVESILWRLIIRFMSRGCWNCSGL